MDIISKAMERNTSLCKNSSPAIHSWIKFHACRKNRKIFVFGTGGGLDYLLRNYYGCIEIEGVIDNDRSRQGQKLGWCCAEAWQTKYEDMLIQSPDILARYDQREIAVLITNTGNCDSMVSQLRKMKIEQYFLLLLMEINKRKEASDSMPEDTQKIKEDYTDWCCSQKIKQNKIVMRIGEYGGHAKRITEQLLQIRDDLNIVWIVHKHIAGLPGAIDQIYEKNWKRYLYEMETAKIWLFDVNVPEFIRKREEQIYIQVKHWASITLKKFYLDDKSSCVCDEIAERIRRDGARMDYLFSGSSLDEESCRSGFAFRGKAVRLGSSRSDILFDKAVRNDVRIKFQLEQDTHILLYAPTYRKKGLDENCSMQITLQMDSLLDTLRDKWGGKWVIFVRLHPWLDFAKSGLAENEKIINAGDYSDSEELVAASDIMITDYSSIMFEGAFVKKPVFLYAPDKQEYVSGERGFLLDYHTLPFPIAGTNEELKQHVLDFDKDSYEKDVESFLNYYDVHEDGHAGERAAKFIADLIECSSK